MFFGVAGFILGCATAALIIRNNPEKAIAWLTKVAEKAKTKYYELKK